MEPKKHTGKRTRIRYIGGDYHGEAKQVRAPIAKTVEVAQPPQYKGGGFYDPSSFGYQTYVLRVTDEGDPVYVWEPWVEDYDKDAEEVINREYESSNARAIRLEKEAEERMRKLMKQDFEKVGFAITLNGARIPASEVKLYVNTKHKFYERIFERREKFFEDKDDST